MGKTGTEKGAVKVQGAGTLQAPMGVKKRRCRVRKRKGKIIIWLSYL